RTSSSFAPHMQSWDHAKSIRLPLPFPRWTRPFVTASSIEATLPAAYARRTPLQLTASPIGQRLFSVRGRGRLGDKLAPGHYARLRSVGEAFMKTAIFFAIATSALLTGSYAATAGESDHAR